MIEWNLFYKMLGIPEEVAEPTYYDLLGLHPETCCAELVDRMLLVQKNRLRQNIPGPQFIPLILSFEQKKLERAAAVLRDPRTREKYHEHLQKKASQRRSCIFQKRHLFLRTIIRRILKMPLKCNRKEQL